MRVIYKPTGQLGDIPDDKFDPVLFSVPQTTPTPEAPPVVSQPVRPTIQPSLSEKVGQGVIGLGKNLAKPFVETGKNIGTAAIITPQALLTTLASRINPELGAKIASKDILGTQERARKISENPEEAIRKQLGESLKVASYAVPFGRGANFLTKATLPGAVVGGLQEAGDVVQGKAAPSAIAGGAILGGAGATVLHGLTKLPKIFTKIGKEEQKFGSATREGVRRIKQPASVFGAGQEKEINDTLNKLRIKGTPAQQYAQLEPKLNELETKIQQIIKDNPTIVIGKEEIKKAFMDNLKSSLRSKDLTNKQAVSEVDGYLSDLIKASGGKGKFTNIDLGRLRDLKKLVNEDYSQVYKIKNTGGTLTPRQKVVDAAWDSLDEAVRNASPKMKALLKDESNLYKSAQSLSSARFNPPTLRAFGTSVPGGITQGVQDVAGRVITKTGELTSKVGGVLPQIPETSLVGQIGGQASSRLPLISIPKQTQEENYQPQDYGGEDDTTSDLPHISSIPETGKESITGHSVNDLGQAYIKAITNNDEINAPILKKMYDMEVSYQKTQGKDTKSLSSTQINQVNLAKSGLRGLNKAEQLLGLRDETGVEIPNANINMSILTKQLVPGKLLTRDYEAAAFSATEALLRARSGAAVPETEVKRYTQKLFPVFGDSEATVKQKLAELRNIFGDLTNQQGAADQDILQNLITP